LFTFVNNTFTTVITILLHNIIFVLSAVCTALTDLFSLTKGMRVLGFNDRGISPQTLADCKTQCIEDTDCMSFEYNTDSGRCRRSSLSKRMVQDALPDFILFDTEFVDFYDRDCL
jgi:hypothetical protein